jgi:hypothetical protein
MFIDRGAPPTLEHGTIVSISSWAHDGHMIGLQRIHGLTPEPRRPTLPQVCIFFVLVIGFIVGTDSA